MGNGISGDIKPTTRLIPREPLQEKFNIPEEEPGYPTARIPSTNKKDIYHPEDNRDIYFHALRAPKDIEKSWDTLVHYLTSIYRTDMMKVRSIFAWLGTQEIERESFFLVSTPSCVDDITPRGYKKIIKAREGSYATLFALICRKAGIKCAIVNGISKGYGYEVGVKTVEHLRDRWVAVYIDGWRLIHLLWAYKNIVSYKNGKWIPKTEKKKLHINDVTEDLVPLKHSFNEYYFLANPNELATVCLPDNEKWQLGSSKITLAKWIDMPHLQCRYHMDGVKLASEFKSTLHTKDGICGIVVKAPDQNNDYQLSYDLFFNHINKRPEVDEPIYLSRYVLMTRDSRDKKWSIETRMPIAGAYRITVYGGSSHQKRLPWILDVAVNCEKPAKNIKPYPDSPKIGFGPVTMTEKAGLVDPSHTNGALFVNPRQIYHITFKVQQTIVARAELIGGDMQEKEMQNWVKCTLNNQSKLSLLDTMVELKKEGEYALKIFVRPRDDKKAEWKNVCNYYLSTDAPRSNGARVKDKGYKTARELNARKTLEEASKGKDLYELKTAVQQFKNEGLHEVDGSFGKATNKMEYLELVKGLNDAIARRNVDLLQISIAKAQEYEHAPKLESVLLKAQAELDKLLKLNHHMHDVLEMKQSTISEMVSYNKPIPVIQDVLTATLLLLGEDKSNIEAWDEVKAVMRQTGQGSILRRLRQLDVSSLDKWSISEAGLIIQQYDEDTVRAASAGAGTFYLWIKSIVEDESTV